jgi:hypothetical protein
MSLDQPGSLMASTLTLLKDDKRTSLDIHKETGLSFYWLKKFGNGCMENPSVNKVQHLWEFLSSKKLNVA